MAVTTYDPQKVLASVGSIPITGYASDTFISIEYSNDFYTVQVGADGKANTRSRNNNRSARVTFTLLQSSPTNDLLTALFQADELAGAGVQALLIKDQSSGAKFSAESCWIAKTPNAEFAAEAGGWEWVIETDDLKPVYGDPLERLANF